MTVTDNVKMTINIGGEAMRLEVPYDNQIKVREAEKKADNLYKENRLKFPSRSESQVLAMVAFSLAQECVGLLDVSREAASMVNDCLHKLSPDITELP